MMRRTIIPHKIDSVFTLLIFCAFSIAVLMVLIFGARVYEDIIAQNQDSENQRITVAYIEAKIRHNDTLDNIYVDSFKGYTEETAIDTLYLEEDYGTHTYHTMIYLADGWVRELYCEKGLNFNPDDGSKIVEAEALNFIIDPQSGLLSITCTDKTGTTMSLSVLPRCMKETNL